MQPEQTKAVLSDMKEFNTCFVVVTKDKVVYNFAFLWKRFDLYIAEFDKMLEFWVDYLR